jgi:hypothetical protein
MALRCVFPSRSICAFRCMADEPRDVLDPSTHSQNLARTAAFGAKLHRRGSDPAPREGRLEALSPGRPPPPGLTPDVVRVCPLGVRAPNGVVSMTHLRHSLECPGSLAFGSFLLAFLHAVQKAIEYAEMKNKDLREPHPALTRERLRRFCPPGVSLFQGPPRRLLTATRITQNTTITSTVLLLV